MEVGFLTISISQPVVPRSMLPVNLLFSEELFQYRFKSANFLIAIQFILCLQIGIKSVYSGFDVLRQRAPSGFGPGAEDI